MVQWLRICLTMQGLLVRSLVREDPLEKEWLLTPVFLPGESHGQRSLALVHVGPKELDMTEGLTHTRPSHCISIFSGAL